MLIGGLIPLAGMRLRGQLRADEDTFWIGFLLCYAIRRVMQLCGMQLSGFHCIYLLTYISRCCYRSIELPGLSFLSSVYRGGFGLWMTQPRRPDLVVRDWLGTDVPFFRIGRGRTRMVGGKVWIGLFFRLLTIGWYVRGRHSGCVHVGGACVSECFRWPSNMFGSMSPCGPFT